MALEISNLFQGDRVHRRVYTDPEIFEEEMRRIFHRVWLFVGHESEVPYPGDYKTLTVGLQPLFLSRHTDGKVYVMYNRCRHRGPVVCREESGHSKQFRCLYHGWTYRTDGALVGVPAQEGLRALGPEWVIFARGVHREKTGTEGERISGAGTDETSLRGQYRYGRS